jgi:hypothetical protein
MSPPHADPSDPKLIDLDDVARLARELLRQLETRLGVTTSGNDELTAERYQAVRRALAAADPGTATAALDALDAPTRAWMNEVGTHATAMRAVLPPGADRGVRVALDRLEAALAQRDRRDIWGSIGELSLAAPGTWRRGEDPPGRPLVALNDLFADSRPWAGQEIHAGLRTPPSRPGTARQVAAQANTAPSQRATPAAPRSHGRVDPVAAHATRRRTGP